MAITKIFTRKDRIDHLIDYISNGEKTEECRYISGVNCAPESAAEMMRATYALNDKPLRVEGYHIIQSFKSGETDAKTAHQIGVELAKRMWGNRFQAVIATHTNTQTCHNHITLCSTSFIDGKRYHSCKDAYKELRDTSDTICREYGLSVIEEPENKSYKSFAEKEAERKGQPTWRTLIKADVDDSIEHATNTKQFYENLKNLGYEIKTGKDISVRPPCKERYVRLARNFGSGYTEEAIRQRLLSHYDPRPSITRPRAKDPVPKTLPPVPEGSIAVLYHHYLYLFDFYRNQAPNTPRQRVPYVLREDIRKFNAIVEDNHLLITTGIKTDVELAAFQNELEERVAALVKERRPLYRIANNDCREVALEAKERIAAINAELKPYRKMIRQCKRIIERTETLEAKIRQIEKDIQPLAKGRDRRRSSERDSR